MRSNTFVFSAIAALAATVQADSCAAGAILGIYGVCGTNPVDCGSGKCCLADQKCVGSGTSIACADSSLQTGTTLTVNAGCYGTATSTTSSATSTPISSKSSSNPATIATPIYTESTTKSSGTKSPSSSLAPSTTATAAGTKTSVTATSTSTSPGKSTGTSTSTSIVTLTGGSTSKSTLTTAKPLSSNASKASSAIVTSVPAPYTYTNGTVWYSVPASGAGSSATATSTLVLSNGASSLLTSPRNGVAVLLSAVAAVMFWL